MVDRLLVDVDTAGLVSVSALLDGELPGLAAAATELACPLDAGDVEDLRWYLEDYLRAPFGVYGDRGPRIADRLPVWGEALFAAVFGAGPARDAYVRARARAVSPGDVEVVLRSPHPAWLALPWELLRDPALPAPLALDGVGISRSLPTATFGPAFEVSGKRLRVLMVISRPDGVEDVGYRMIARPLLRRLEAVRGRVEVEVLRPPTLEALSATLWEAREAGEPYQIVHFDGHGVLTGDRPGVGAPLRYGTTDEGALVFEKPGGGADRVPAGRVAQVLSEARVPVVVLNACQSGAVGKELEAAVATRLLAGGASAVVAMAYSVYAVAAAEFMAAFYERLFAGAPVSEAVRAGRTWMARRPERPSPKGDLPLADWVVPVHYLRREVRFPQLRAAARSGGVSLKGVLTSLREGSARPADDPLAAAEEFVGRDGLFYTLEVAARTQRVVVLHGPAGTGKSELAKAFGRWWRDTGAVERPEWVVWHSFEPGVASFGLDGVIAEIGSQVYGVDAARQDPATRRELVENLLREHRLLLIWDNFESVASMPDPAAATPPLNEPARDELREFLARIATGGRSAVLVTSRTPETWLGDVRRLEVGGLARHEAIEYADQLLAPFPATVPRRTERAFADLLEWLDGHPLSMRLTLPHLDTTGAATILAGLRGTTPLPSSPGADRTTSLAASIAYSFNHLTGDDRRRLTALTLLHGVADEDVLAVFSGQRDVPARFGGVGPEEWQALLTRSVQLGLLTATGLGMYGIHPALPSYLAEQWRLEDPDTYPEQRELAERAMLDAHAAFGEWLYRQIESSHAATAYQLLAAQRRTMGHLLGYALDSRSWEQALHIARPLERYWTRSALDEEARGWIDRARLALEGPDGSPPPLGGPAGELWMFFATVQAGRLTLAGGWDAANAIYTEILDQFPTTQSEPARLRPSFTALYLQFGLVARQRGRLDEAEDWFSRALALYEERGDSAGVAHSHHEFGKLAVRQGNLDEAEDWLRRALAMYEQLGDRNGVGNSHYELGTVALRQAKLDEAEGFYRRALEVYLELGDLPHSAYVYNQLGAVAHERGSPDKAEGWYQRSLLVKEALGDRRGMAHSYFQIGQVALAQGQLDQAEEWIRQALAIFREFNYLPSQVDCYSEMGRIAAQRRELEQATEWAVRAVTVFGDFPHPMTRPAPDNLAMLTRWVGMEVLEAAWERVTGGALPMEVREFVEAYEVPEGMDE
ncbi:MAG: tetratricopeptide repeat protein [Mycobacteriales bacterium]